MCVTTAVPDVHNVCQEKTVGYAAHEQTATGSLGQGKVPGAKVRQLQRSIRVLSLVTTRTDEQLSGQPDQPDHSFLPLMVARPSGPFSHSFLISSCSDL